MGAYGRDRTVMIFILFLADEGHEGRDKVLNLQFLVWQARA